MSGSNSQPADEQQPLAHGTHSEAMRPSALWAQTITWGLILSAGLAVTWLVVAKTEEIVVAPGQLEPIGKVIDVQVPVGGVVKDVLVEEGQRVEKGQLLLRLDQEASADRVLTVRNTIALKEAEIALKIQEATRFLELNRSEQMMLEAQLALDQDILQRLEALNKEGASSELVLLQQRNKTRETQGKLDQAKIERRRQETIINQQLKSLETDVVNLKNQSTEARIQERHEEVRSPVSGLVFQLQARDAGFVTQSSEPILQIVPFDNLEAKVEVASSDIGFVSVGDQADISIDSFPASDFGALEGSVRQIGSDAFPPDPQQVGSVYRFPVQITLSSQQLKIKDGQELSLQTGMSLTANIKLREVSYLQLLLGSFRDKAQSLRRI